eukprot:15460250-Alexandrium_andersonii.AAC.1
MSASLVGSEMCIRDRLLERPCGGAQRGLPRESVLLGHGRRARPESRRGPVGPRREGAPSLQGHRAADVERPFVAASASRTPETTRASIRPAERKQDRPRRGGVYVRPPCVVGPRALGRATQAAQ